MIFESAVGLWFIELFLSGGHAGLAGIGAVVRGVWVWARADELASRRVLFASYATGSAAVVGVACLAMAALVSLTDWGTARHKRLD